MTEYIKNQLIKLCNHPEWFNDMLISLDNNPEEPHMYLILGILDEDERPRTVLLGKPKFNPQLN